MLVLRGYRRPAAGPVSGAIVVWSAAVALLGGCTSTGNVAAITPVQHALLPGVPLPSGFELVPERSVARTSGQLRIAKCEYSGRVTPGALNRWFKEYMPTGGFKLIEDRLDSGTYHMRYESDAEECLLTIRPAAFNKTTLIVELGPQAKGLSERASQPPPAR